MEFHAYLKQQLNKPVNNDSYCSNGNSARAVVTRGFWREVLWQYKAYPRRLKYELMSFDGLSTELGWFLQLPLMILLSPILPIFAAKHWYNRSMGEYKDSYERAKKHKKDYNIE
jgi:hypothetical protein